MAITGLFFHSRLVFVPILLGVVFLSGGCVTLNDPESSQEYRADTIAKVSEGQIVGQSFVSRRPRLNSISLWLNVEADPAIQNGNLTAELFHNPEETNPLAVVVLSFDEIARAKPVRISIPPQADPPGQSYYISLKTSDGVVQVSGRNEDIYPWGQTFISNRPVGADFAFRLTYDYDAAGMFSDLKNILPGVWLLFPLAITILVPGWLLLNLSGLGVHFDMGERIAISVGLSLAVIPLLMSWTTALGLTWNRTNLLVASVFLGAIAGWRWLRSTKINFKPKINLTALAVVLVFVFSLGVRLAMVRDLAAPPWVDSVHHGLITRLIIEQGAFPDTYAPYLDIDSARYHAGFHSVVALFHWFSGLEIHKALLLVGQLLNALTVFAVYLFTNSFTKNRIAGVIAAFITGLITPMPAYYTSWGRYTQLAGLLILPVAMAWIQLLPRTRTRQDNVTRKEHLTMILIAGITCGGLFLTHYRVAAFFGLLILAYLSVRVGALMRGQNFIRNIAKYIGSISLIAIVAMILTLPWWPTTLMTLFIPKYTAWSGAEIAAFSDFSWGFLTTALGRYAMILAGIGLLWGIIQRKGFTLILTLWVVFLFFIANLGALHLPGGGFVNNTSVEITLFIPISVLAGYILSQVIAAWRAVLPGRWHKLYFGSLWVAGLAVALIGARHLIPILNPTTMLFRSADQPAMDWIQDHIPPDETVLINPFAWGYGLYAGQDGGFWITPLTGRKTMPPPVLYGLDNSKSNIQRINEINQRVIEKSADIPELHLYMNTLGIQYVYLGARGGVLSPKAIYDSELFEVLYTQAGVWIFKTR